MNTKGKLSNITPYETKSGENKIRLDLNECLRGCSPDVIKALKKIGPEDISSYPEYEPLTEKIAQYHQVDQEKILLTNGADEAIRLIMEAFLEEHHTIVLPVPTFSMFEILAKPQKATIKKVLYNEDLSFPLQKVINAAKLDPKLICIVNPGSPTGTVLTRKDISQILNAAQNSILMLDETYADFSKSNISCIDMISQYNNLIILRSFSKSFGLAGVRLGYIVSNANTIRNLHTVKLPFSVNSLSVIAGIAALSDIDYMKETVAKTNQEKEFLYNNLSKLLVTPVMTHTNFLVVKIGENMDMDTIIKKLSEKGILVKSLQDYPLLSDYIRISMGSHAENGKFLKALKEILEAQK